MLMAAAAAAAPMPAGPALLLRKARALLQEKGEIGELTAKQAAAGVCHLARCMVDKPAGVDTVLRRPDGWAWLLSSLQVHVQGMNYKDHGALSAVKLPKEITPEQACQCARFIITNLDQHKAAG